LKELTLETLYDHLEASGFAIGVEQGELVLKGPRGALAPDVVTFIRQNKPALLRYVEQQQACRRDGQADLAVASRSVRITPDMLTMVKLSQEQIDAIVKSVPGGAANVQDIYPLTPSQEGLLFHSLLDADRDIFLLVHLAASTSRRRLEQFVDALRGVVDRHDVLRTSIAWEGLEEPVQIVHRQVRIQVEELDIDPALGDVEEQIQQRFDPRRYRIDVTQAPLIRCHLAHDPVKGRWLLCLLTHHLVMDNTTLGQVMVEATAFAHGRAHLLPAPAPYRNFVAQARLGVSAAEHEAFFTQMLADIDEPTAPFGLLDVQGDGSETVVVSRHLDPRFSEDIRAAARALGVSAASVMHLAWAMVLARTCGRETVVFGTVLFGRMRGGPQADSAMGLFINTLPIRIDLARQTVRAALKQAHDRLARLMHHEHAQLALAQRCGALDAQVPLFTSQLNYRHVPDLDQNPVADSTADDDIVQLNAVARTNYPFAMAVDDDRKLGFHLTAQINARVEANRILDFMQEALEQLLAGLTGAPDAPVSGMNVLPARERMQLLAWSGDVAVREHGPCVHHGFERQVVRSPEAIAIVAEGGAMTYAELNARANRLAHYLATLGVVPGARVAIALERGPDMIVAMLAALKAGGAYVPLDPGYPAERLAFMLADSAPAVLITQRAMASVLGPMQGTLAVLAVDDAELPWQACPTANPDGAILGLDGSCTAYVIYTSGSTGQPKGAAVSHEGFVNLLHWYRTALNLSPADRVLPVTSYSFDLTQKNLLGLLQVGGCVVLSPVPFEPNHLCAMVRTHAITLLNLTPGAFNALFEADDGGSLASLRHLVLGGEPVNAGHMRRLAERYPDLRVVNSYGPTECADVCAFHVLRPEDLREDAVIPVGRPVPNARLYVLDADANLLPIGVTGEIVVGGCGVGAGYVNQPGLTAGRFLADPFARAAGQAGARMYRTGDLGRWRHDGTLEFLGRKDHQVKVRGFRIEPGEIETRLLQHEGVRDAVVIAREEGPGDKRLVAYYVGGADGAPASVHELRAHVARTLPDYMVPSAFVALRELPLTPNGKVDRRRLPPPDGNAYAQREYDPPRTEMESTLAALWAELLKVERVGRMDNFFELGGHSLLAMSLIERMRRQGLHTDVRSLFSSPTLSAVAAATEQLEETEL
jgi:amino acid adenylation domain-containing protein